MVKVGSVFENNNATFLVETADETPTGYSGVANSTTFYLYYDESGGAFIFSSTAPTWSDALQGYYNGNDRAFFSMYKDSGGTLYENKAIIKSQSYDRQESLKLTGQMEWKRYYESSTAVTEDTFYDAISPYLGTVFDFMRCHGQVVGGKFSASGSSILSIAQGSGFLRVIAIDFNGTIENITATNGTGTTFCDKIEMMMNFDKIT